MAGQIPSYRRLYPAEESIIFDGGLDTKFEKALIPDNESPDCLNTEFVNGAVCTRQGGVKLNTNAVGSGAAFDGLYTRRDNNTNESMCAFIGGHMFTLGATTFNTVPSAQSVFTMGQRVGSDMAENYLFIGNGGAGCISSGGSAYGYKWDGTYFTLHGVPQLIQSGVVVASGSTGSLTTSGAYQYKFSFVNSALVEGNVSTATVTFVLSSTGASNALGLTNIPVAPTSFGVARRRIYRTIASGTAFLKVADINDNTSTTYTDAVADASLGVAAPTDNGLPPAYNAIIYHRNILFVNDVNNPNYVWYSTIGQPYTFASTNFFKVGDRTSDLVKGFASYDNYIVVFCELSTWINFMPDPATPSGWRQIKSNSPYGSKSPYSLLNCNVRGQDVLLHPAVQNKIFVGFGGLTGTTLDPSISLQPVTSAGSDLQSQLIETDMFSVQSGYLVNISGMVYKNRAFISLTYGANNTTNNRIYVWDYSLSNLKKDQPASWVPWSGTPMSVQQMTIYGGKLYGGTSGTSGFVYQIADTGVYSDDGSAINCYWWSKEFPGYQEDTALTKDFRYLNMLYDNAGSYYMNLVYRTDSDKGGGNSVQINLTSGSTVWGPTMIWGVSTWGGGTNQTEDRIYLGSTRGKRLQFRFDNQNKVNQRFKVHRAQFAYNIRGYR